MIAATDNHPSAQTMPNDETYVMPAEFEPQSAIWMGWPTFQWYEDPSLDTRQPLAEIVKVLSDYRMPVQVMCTDDKGEREAKDWLTSHGYDITPYMKFPHIAQIDIWMRDFGPIFVRNASDQLAISSFQQNQWGYSTVTDRTSKAMSAVPGLVGDYLGIDKRFPTPVVSEGGDRIVNGRGALLVCRAVEFQRNPNATQGDLEAAYMDTLGATDVIWLDSGVYEDLHSDWGPIPYTSGGGTQIALYGPQSTGGHLDEFVRFSDTGKIILARVSECEAASNPIYAVNYTRCEEAYRVLSKAVLQDGSSLEIDRLPVPEIECREISTDDRMYQWLSALNYPNDMPPFPAGHPAFVVKSSSYANYLVTDRVVIAPKYGSSEKDDMAAETLQAAFKDRAIVQIDPSPINYAGGGIHCCTQQQPAGTVAAHDS